MTTTRRSLHQFKNLLKKLPPAWHAHFGVIEQGLEHRKGVVPQFPQDQRHVLASNSSSRWIVGAV